MKLTLTLLAALLLASMDAQLGRVLDALDKHKRRS
jgi:arylsulfatase A-like enzyme